MSGRYNTRVAMRLSGDCPKCSKPLVRKTRRADGNGFLSCSGYPDCRFAEDLDPHLDDLATQIRELNARVDELQAQVRRQAQQPPRSQSGGGLRNQRGSLNLSRELRDLIAAAHPDRWPGAPELAHLMASRLNALRSKL